MQNNFDLKKFLIENKLTPSSQKLNEDDWGLDNYGMDDDDFQLLEPLPAPPKKSSFEDKWNEVDADNKEVLKKSTGKEPIRIMASSKGINYVITKGSDGKFYRYNFRQAENPGKPFGPFNSEEEAKKID
jgi:hypothetical protein